jgi:hypothetical protein
VTRRQTELDRWDGRAFYYALVARNGSTVGKRISTRMAIITDATFDGSGQLVECKGFIACNDLTGWSTSKRSVAPSEILRKWRSRPMLKTISAAKQRLPVYEGAP